MKNRILFFCLLITTGVYFVACTNDKVEPAMNDCSSDVPIWEGEVDAIVALTCAYSGCHVSGSGIGNYNSFSGINAVLRNGKFKSRVIDVKNMPPPSSSELTAEQLLTVTCWMEAGFPEN